MSINSYFFPFLIKNGIKWLFVKKNEHNFSIVKIQRKLKLQLRLNDKSFHDRCQMSIRFGKRISRIKTNDKKAKKVETELRKEIE